MKSLIHIILATDFNVMKQEYKRSSNPLKDIIIELLSMAHHMTKKTKNKLKNNIN